MCIATLSLPDICNGCSRSCQKRWPSCCRTLDMIYFTWIRFIYFVSVIMLAYVHLHRHFLGKSLFKIQRLSDYHPTKKPDPSMNHTPHSILSSNNKWGLARNLLRPTLQKPFTKYIWNPPFVWRSQNRQQTWISIVCSKRLLGGFLHFGDLNLT